ncbi:MAG: Rhomboid family protein [uncultured Caballeronia sp.]|nr:MAG: Rhomboid family protein [uncultured Caballeronia sp.]
MNESSVDDTRTRADALIAPANILSRPFIGSRPLSLLLSKYPLFLGLYLSMRDDTKHTNKALAKVPELTLVFWMIKIAATTLGETGGDALSM